jgi:hypothetical protein
LRQEGTLVDWLRKETPMEKSNEFSGSPVEEPMLWMGVPWAACDTPSAELLVG